MRGDFDTLWRSAILLGVGGYASVQGVRIALRRRVENPWLELRGGRALGVGLALCGLGVAAAVYAARTMLALRGAGG